MNTRPLFLGAIALVTFLGASLIAYAAARAPGSAGLRPGLLGLKRQRALAKAGAFSFVEPIISWLGLRIAGLLSPSLKASLEKQIMVAGGYLGLVAEELVALSLLGGLGGFGFASVFSEFMTMGLTFKIATTTFGAFAPFLWLSSATRERAVALSRRLPDAVDLLALGMSAGLDFPGALRQAVDRSGTPDDPLIEELALVLQSLQLGRTRREALEELAERAPVDAIREFVAAVVQAELRGNPLSDVLRIQAEVSRQRRSVRAEEVAAKASLSLLGPLVLVFVAVIALVAGPMVIRLMESF